MLWPPSSMCSLHTQHLLAATAVVPGPPEAGTQDSTGRSQGPTWRDLPTGHVSRTSKSSPHQKGHLYQAGKESGGNFYIQSSGEFSRF